VKISIAILAACASTLALTTAFAQTGVSQGAPYQPGGSTPLAAGTKSAPAPTGANPNDAPISTTRSNIRHPNIEANPNGSGGPIVDNGGRADPPNQRPFLGNKPIIEK
jgi:hypothetical protein